MFLLAFTLPFKVSNQPHCHIISISSYLLPISEEFAYPYATCRIFELRLQANIQMQTPHNKTETEIETKFATVTEIETETEKY